MAHCFHVCALLNMSVKLKCLNEKRDSLRQRILIVKTVMTLICRYYRRRILNHQCYLLMRLDRARTLVKVSDNKKNMTY